MFVHLDDLLRRVDVADQDERLRVVLEDGRRVAVPARLVDLVRAGERLHRLRGRADGEVEEPEDGELLVDVPRVALLGLDERLRHALARLVDAPLVRVDDGEAEDRRQPLARLPGRLRELQVLERARFGLRPVAGPEVELRQVAERVRQRALVALVEGRLAGHLEPVPGPLEVAVVLEPGAEGGAHAVSDDRSRRDALELEGALDEV